MKKLLFTFLLLTLSFSISAMDNIDQDQDRERAYFKQQKYNADYFYIACVDHNVRLLKQALDDGISPDTPVYNLLETTLAREAFECVDLLLQRGVTVTVQHIQASISNQNDELFKRLITACNNLDVMQISEVQHYFIRHPFTVHKLWLRHYFI